MTLNIAQLRKRVATRFPDVEQVDDSIIRFTKKEGELPFAVCYVDIGQDLPGTPETLTKYQDRVIGSHYFEGRKSLQWSNYLYFVTSGDRLASRELRGAKELIERDRNYARKFVIAEEDLDSILTLPVIEPTTATLQASVLSIWIDHLEKAGLDGAILSDDDLPTRLALIEASSAGSAPSPKAPRRNAALRASPFIRSLQLKQFRDFPVQRGFEFGTVNLIFGTNGSGKTSLLEAIELFYCGRNKRNPNASDSYELTVVLADGRPESATDSCDLQIFRDRNLTWYGQSEVKTNNLYLSFGQFNFLDTDAAVSLTADEKSPGRIEEDLSKLLVGPDASKTWRDIERVHDALKAKLHDLRPLETQITAELDVLENRLRESGAIRQESDSISTRLIEMIHRVGWREEEDDKEVFAGRLVESLSELMSLAQQAAALHWTESPVSVNGMAKYCLDAKVTGDKAERDIARLEVLEKNRKHLTNAIERDREALTVVKEVRRSVDADVPNRVAERDKEQTSVATYSGWLAGVEAERFAVVSAADLDMPVDLWYAAAVSKCSAAEDSLISAKGEYTNFSKLRDQSLNLAQELRQIASKILQGNAKPDECPLCHTQFAPGDLAKHMSVGVDEHLEVLGQTLLNQVTEQEIAVREGAANEAAFAWLKKFCERASLDRDISVRSALAEVESAKRALAEARSRFEALNIEVLTLESQGFSVARLEEISARLRELGYPLTEFSHEAIDRLSSTIDQSLAISSRTIEQEKNQASELQHTLQANLGSAESDLQDLKGALSQLKERLASTQILRAKLAGFSSSFPWPGERPLAELAVEAESVRNVAAELQAALGKEKRAKLTFTESTNRKALLQKEIDELRPRLKRLTDAHSALERLQKEHSLTAAMESALQQNRASIEAIFSRIHSPAEFSRLGSRLTTLVRKAGGREAELSEISAGQRSAFALSIFLAQNGQLSLAPPVILIDDPIAHIDDLNSLSFLDYLRDEVALRHRRQIFFATASDKLATLFERKFDFLGAERFRRFDLRR